MNEVSLESLCEHTLTDVVLNDDQTELVFNTKNGAVFKMFHEQDCCERVRLEDICGDLEDLQNCTVLYAYESSRTATADETPESGTWTFYNIGTTKGSVTLRWLGESNGYYGESVSFKEM